MTSQVIYARMTLVEQLEFEKKLINSDFVRSSENIIELYEFIVDLMRIILKFQFLNMRLHIPKPVLYKFNSLKQYKNYLKCYVN